MPGSIVHLGFEHGAGGGVDLVLIFHSVGPEFDLIAVTTVILVQLTLEAGYGRGAETCVGQGSTLGGRGVDGDGGGGGGGVPVIVTVPLRTPDRAVGSQDLVFIFQAACPEFYLIEKAAVVPVPLDLQTKRGGFLYAGVGEGNGFGWASVMPAELPLEVGGAADETLAGPLRT